MEQEIIKKLEELEKKVEEARLAAVAIKKIFIWTLVVSVILFVLPLLGLAFVIPQIFSTYQEIGNIGL